MLPAAYAQETTGGIKGYVKDKSGASVPKAEVELTSTALIVPKKAQADNAGYFYFAVLPPGSYTLSVTAPGFRSYKQVGIPMTAGALPTIDINLEIGSVAETHYSFMGATDPREMEGAAREVAAHLKQDNVDAVLLPPV